MLDAVVRIVLVRPAGARRALALAVALASLAPSAGDAQDSTFLLTSTDVHRSPSPFIGNGRIGLVIPPLGLAAEPSLVAGVYEHGPGDVPRIAAAPAWNGVGLFDGAAWLDTAATGGAIESYRQEIDMRTGTARTRYDWVNGERRTSVDIETFLSRAAPLGAVRLRVTPHQAGRMRLRFALAGWPAPRRLPLATLERASPDWRPADIWYPGHSVVRARRATAGAESATLSLSSTPSGRTTVLAQAATVSWSGMPAKPSVRTRAVGDTAQVEIAFDGAADRSYVFTHLVAFAHSADQRRPLDAARRLATAAAARGYDSLAADNARAWAGRWETDIVVDGDPGLQREIRSMLFYLLCSADSGTGMGIPPMGLSSAGYYGHVFWDADTWMFPALALTHPDAAHSLVGFRARTLPAAKANARANGFRGAMYPWEADEIGNETTPHFAVQNARSEIHINGDVAIAQWQYFLATGDSAWLAREGFPVISGTADFWVSRATYDSTAGRYHIRNVVSVAEGLVGVDDDAYTNAVARRNLELATAAARRLGRPADPRWAHVAAKLHLPVDSASGFFRTYEGAPDSTLGVITPLLAFPLGMPMSDQAKRAHLDQAMSRLKAEASGAMMGITLLSVGAAELGDRRLVDSLLPYSYQHHTQGPFLMLSETPTNMAVNFLTGAGGFLQQVVFGYTGLRFGEHGVDEAFAPVLPSSIRRLLLRNIHVRGRRYDVVVDSAGRRLLPHTQAAPR